MSSHAHTPGRQWPPPPPAPLASWPPLDDAPDDGTQQQHRGDEDDADSVGEQSGEFGAPPMPPLPSEPFPAASSRANAYRVDGHDDGHDADEGDDDYHAAEDVGFGVPNIGRSRAGRAARVGVHGSQSALSPDEGEGDSSDDDENESSMIMHTENTAGHRHSFSHSAQLTSALEHFASPPPPVHPASPRRQPPPVPPSSPSPGGGAGGNGSSAVASASPGQGHRSALSSSGASPAAAAPTSAAAAQEVSTIEYYLRQALQARDLPALSDLLARASEKGIVTDLVTQAKGVLSDARAEARNDEISMLKHYMKASIDARQKEACWDVLKKVEPLALQLSTGPQRRLYADFFTLVAECQQAVESMEREDAQTVSAYLKQGVQQRSRELLQAWLAKATSVKHSLLDAAILAQAKNLLGELDSQVMLRNFLALAVKNRELVALEESIAQASKLHLTERDAPELGEAKRLLEDLRAHPGSASSSSSNGGSNHHASSSHGHNRLSGGSGGADGSAGSGETKEQKALRKERERAEKADREQKARAEKEARHAQEKAAKAEKDAAKHDQVKEKGKWFGSGGKDKDKDKKAASTTPGGSAASAAAAASSSSSGPRKLFGGSLSEAMRRNPSGSGLPRVVESCASFLRSSGALQEPGLFRVAGNKDNIDLLRAAFEDDYALDSSSDSSARAAPALTEIHDASGLFKLYFRLLPEPLIPFDLYAAFIKVGMNKGEERIGLLRDLALQLPKDNIVMLRFLFTFLHEVSTHSAVNKMTPENLAIVFAPNLIRPKVETPQSMMTDMSSGISVIASFIAEVNTIFGEQNGAGGAAAGAQSS